MGLSSTTVISGFFGSALGFGRGLLWTDDDGVAWHKVDGISQNCHLVAGSPWVAIGDSGYLFYSADGKTWAHGNHPDIFRGYDIAYGAGTWVAVGENVAPITFNHIPVVVTSTDGINWTEQTLPPDIVSNWVSADDVLYGGGVWIVGGDPLSTGPTFVRSVDAGVTWVEVPNPDDFEAAEGLGYNAQTGVFVAWVVPRFDGDSTIGYSTDQGLTWTRANATGAEGAFDARFASHGPDLVCVPRGRGLIPPVLRSADGVDWVEVPTGYDAPFATEWRDVCWDGARWVIAGTGEKLPSFTDAAAVVTSPDLATWTGMPWPGPSGALMLSNEALGLAAVSRPTVNVASVSNRRAHRLGPIVR